MRKLWAHRERIDCVERWDELSVTKSDGGAVVDRQWREATWLRTWASLVFWSTSVQLALRSSQQVPRRGYASFGCTRFPHSVLAESLPLRIMMTETTVERRVPSLEIVNPLLFLGVFCFLVLYFSPWSWHCAVVVVAIVPAEFVVLERVVVAVDVVQGIAGVLAARVPQEMGVVGGVEGVARIGVDGFQVGLLRRLKVLPRQPQESRVPTQRLRVRWHRLRRPLEVVLRPVTPPKQLYIIMPSKPIFSQAK